MDKARGLWRTAHEADLLESGDEVERFEVAELVETVLDVEMLLAPHLVQEHQEILPHLHSHANLKEEANWSDSGQDDANSREW